MIWTMQPVEIINIKKTLMVIAVSVFIRCKNINKMPINGIIYQKKGVTYEKR